MTQQALSPAAFEAVRSRLFGLAYRMLGSRADAEDVAQETYVRWHRAEQYEIDNAEAWLVTATTRLAIDRLRRLKTERAAFLLHDVFEVEYGRIASILDKSEAACRQMIHRARERVRGSRKRFESSEAGKAALLEQFKAAAEAGDEQVLLALFAPDAIWTADGGGKTAAGPRPLVGVEAIVRLLLGLRRNYWTADRVLEPITVNGEPGLCIRDGGQLTAVMAFDTDGEQIVSVYAVLNPDKLDTARPS